MQNRNYSLALITAIIFSLPLGKGWGWALAQKKEITLEDLFQKNTFAVKRIYGIRSMKNGEHYTTQGANTLEQFIVMYEYKTGNAVDTVLKSSWMKSSPFELRSQPSVASKGGQTAIEIEDYQFNADESKLLISSESEQIYRHSTRENYYIYDRKTKATTFISQNGKQMYAEFSPDGSKIGFVRDNNLFVYDIASKKETQVTSDGKVNNIINGATDWVYEEEFSFDKAWFWSPDGNKIAYYRFDESKVKEFSMNKYGTLYPTEYKFKYPKAGEDNSKVSIFIYDVKTALKQMIDLGNDYEYIPRIKWTQFFQPMKIGSDITLPVLSIQRMNRLQNKLELLLAYPFSAQTTTILTETSDTYIEISDNLTFLPNGKEFIWTSERDGYNHLYLYNINGDLNYQITKGNWEVTELKGYDDKKQIIYYLSDEISPNEKTLYSITLDGQNRKKLSPIPGTDDAEFNSTCTYYIHTYTNANRPPVTVLRSADGAEVRTLEDNTALLRKLNDYNLVTKEFFKFKTSDGTELNGWMMKPPQSPEGGKNKSTSFNIPPSGGGGAFPVLMFVYGGPGANTVNDTWDRDYFWYQMLCAKGYIIVSVDNRGTGGRGKKFRDCTYKQLGKYETEDQIEAAKYLGTLPYVDKNRIGIWGWSYGGYMSSLCIMKGADIFKMAIAVAPVTNWIYYDNIYTERYMGLPKDNAKGYDDNSPINHVDKLKGNFLLVHGTGDDNVHFQNSAEMISALQQANKQFDLMIYPDKNHSIYGGNTRLHLYTKLTNFVLGNL
ncbi:MAG: S9 family peptidase [Bacteroidetes bacterium]|nr:S9 family peptidase [Bacteroidota bacterium]